MDYGYQLLRHVVQQVFGNLGSAARLTLPPFVIPFLIVVLGAPGLLSMQAALSGVSQSQATGSVVLIGILALITGIIAWLWAAVAWHRFVLKEEYPSGFLPPWHGANMASYFGNTLLIGLVLFAGVLIIGIAVAAIAAALPFGAMTFLLGVGFVFGISWVAMRLGLILPAAAIGEKLTLGASWQATRPVSGQIIMPMIVIALVFAVIGQVVLLIFGTEIPLPEGVSPEFLMGQTPRVLGLTGQLVNLVVIWIQMLINLALLTTLYGNLVEGRQLN